MSSLRTLLAGLIDYAGLFPPASLGMPQAVDAYATYLVSEHAWALGRFIVPVARLDEFAAVQQQTRNAHRTGQEWKLSVLATAADAPAIARFNTRHAGAMTIDTAEIKAAGAAEIRDAARALRTHHLHGDDLHVNDLHPDDLHLDDLHLDLYFEAPPADGSNLLPVIADSDARAKIRTGGVTPATIPPTEEVAAFLEACRAHRVAFKATAGLHHPVRSVRPLTYEPGCAQAAMHGFLNVFLAAALVYSGGSAADTRALLNETDATAFRFDDGAAYWRTRVAFPTSLLAETRARFAASFGSCSFTEPMDEVEALYKLEAQEQLGIPKQSGAQEQLGTQEQLGIQEQRAR
ncbi:MAG: hypothetical protein ACR2JE_15320 [Acidobacteriaceae bacterium]